MAGRPRDVAKRARILDVAAQMLREEGVAGTTIEAIAKRASVSKPTIYRWWTSRGDLALDALGGLTDTCDCVDRNLPRREQLLGGVRDLYGIVRSDGVIEFIDALMIDVLRDAELEARFRTGYLEQIRARFREVWGPSPAGAEALEQALDIVFGVFWYYVLVERTPMGEATADRMLELALTVAPLAE